jgi:hypothetical protein
MMIVGSMRGKKWNNVKAATKNMLELASKMPDDLVSIFSFDDNTYSLFKEVDMPTALASIDKLKFGGKGTRYSKAIAQIINIIKSEKPEHEKYLSAILFFSDGSGGEITTEMKSLLDIRSAGKRMILDTIACETEDDKVLQQMAVLMNGDHYRTTNSSALRQIYEKILSLT